MIGKRKLDHDQLVSNKQSFVQQKFSFGGRQVHLIEQSKKCNADIRIQKGIKMRSEERVITLEELVLKELGELVIEKVQKIDLRWINPCFAILKSENGQWKKDY
ncbi:MAG: hypothetical protein EZS28_028240 [Streblomastix strix]|uniref:Uncharacterized protein n=1 Tax=Streblomastix strix TaxID=222440 RepID=A0A5J4V1J2_9EUKA|nr:MAG: hypothetical protein EZS28_028240 [Streblomastix strix]